jgi:PadR family transcriptional regulator PadR
MEEDEILENLVLELRRGVIVLAVLSQLQEEQYGYSILKQLSEKGLGVDQGTLYPLLRRMESQGLLYYVASPLGRQILPKVKSEWIKISGTLDKFLEQ